LGVSDGTPEGTTALKDVNTGQYPATLSSFRSAGDKVYFMANDLTHTGNELWVTDGSAAGTHLVREFAPGVASATIDMLHAADGLLYFTVRPTGPEGGELWVTDGTEAGTRLVEDVRPGPAPSAPRRATTFGDKLVFWADDGVHGYEPWVAPHAAAQPPRRAANRRTSYTDGTPRPTTTAAPRDFNRDGIVNWTDLLLARANLGRRIALFDA
jgi:ELWxxDGT repeat protein